MDALIYGWIDGLMDRWIDGLMDRWMDGLIDCLQVLRLVIVRLLNKIMHQS